MRAFVELRRMTQTAADNYNELRMEIQNVKDYVEDILADQNEINEDYRTQLDAISTALAELQSKERPIAPRRRIGFIQDEDN